MADPAPYPSADDADPSPQIQQNLKGDDNQAIGELKGGTAISKIVGNVIYNYYYREEVKIPIDDAAASAETDPLPCPYRGLFHFGPGDAEYFFGRESFVEELVRATQTRNFIPLLGASGSGKSSVVLAGLVPKLQQAGHWQFTHFRPGADPFHALALALVPLYTTNLDETERIRQSRNLAGYFRTGEVLLADVFAQIQQNFPTDRVLLIADQFEELYTLCTDETTRRNFLDRLLGGIAAPVDRIPFAPILIATMRADFLGNALSYRPFADVLQNADLKLGPMNRTELTEAIEKPAQKWGVTFEAGLVERILGDVEAEPGILPLLEFALTELWQRRSGKQLTHAGYEAIGQVQGALTRHADDAIDKISKLHIDAGIKEIQKMQGDLDPQAHNKLKEELQKEKREQIQRVFIQLVRPGEDAEDTRRIATKGELGEESWSLVKELATARLVVSSGLGLMAWKQTQQAELNLADVLGASALSLVEKGKDLDAFIPAIRAGKIQQNQKVSNPSRLNALQEAFNHRSEHNRLEGHKNAVTSVSFSPDGKILATGSGDTIKLWNLDLEALMGRSCDWVRAYLENNINVSDSDKHLCDGIGTKKQ
jgi:hypothetical protein